MSRSAAPAFAPASDRRDPERPRDADAELMARAATGDRAAWRELYLAHRDFVFRVAVRFLGDAGEARDVTQDVFVSLFSSAWRYSAGNRFTTFLWRVVANRCLNERARARTRGRPEAPEAALAAVADPAGSPEERLERAELAAAVRGAIAALPERQRMAVLLSRFEGLSYEEIAAALECSVSSVESLLFRARQNLARALADR